MIPAGAIITCPKCNTELFKARVNILSGMRLDAALFEGINQSVKPMAEIVSFCCGKPPLNPILKKYHTKDGWQ